VSRAPPAGNRRANANQPPFSPPVLAELEACSFRNRTPAETLAHMKPLLERYLPLDSNSSASSALPQQRRKDHYSHFILRLAFAATDDLRRRFCRVETLLFRLRMQTDDARERAAFMASLDLSSDGRGGPGLGLEAVSEDERRELAAELAAVQGAYGGGAGGKPGAKADEDASADAGWFKVDWMRVPELVEQRRVFLRAGKAYVPQREQAAMVCSEFSERLERALVATARALPRLDEDDRLAPILAHLGKNFVTPDAAYAGSSADSAVPGSELTARNVDTLAANHFPLCMQHLHRSLRRDAHLKHFGRLQYTLFLKGVGLSLEECLVFWRQGFARITDDQFNKEYRYNVRHVYGDVGGDSNRRGGGYSPFSCQKILTEHPPGPGEAHGCPYRHFSVENLTSLLQAVGITDRAVLQGVKDDKEKQKFHMACNRYVSKLAIFFIHLLPFGGCLSGVCRWTSPWLALGQDHGGVCRCEGGRAPPLWLPR
jgi:DNA primase large subunit